MFKKVFGESDMPIACDEDGLTGSIVMMKKFSKRITKSITDRIEEKSEQRQRNPERRKGDRMHEQHRYKEK